MKRDLGKPLILIRNLLCLIAISLVPIALFAGARQLTAAPRAAQHVEACAKNLRTLHAAIEAYRKDHAGKFPVWLTEPPYVGKRDPELGLHPKYVKDKAVYICPGDPDEGKNKMLLNPGTPLLSYSHVGGLQAYYVGIPNIDQTLGKKLFDELLTTMGQELRVVSCHFGNHHRAGEEATIHTIKADGSVVLETIDAGMNQSGMMLSLMNRITATTIYPSKDGVVEKKTGGGTTGK